MTTPAAVEPPIAAITIMGSGRLGPTVAALIGLAGVVVAARSYVRQRARSGSPGTWSDPHPARASIAVLLGSVSLAAGVLFAATADGGPGTGNGIVGSIAAIVLGPVAITVAELARRGANRRAVSPAP